MPETQTREVTQWLAAWSEGDTSAIDKLSRLVEDERKSRVVELHYFGELSVEETAAAVGVSDETIRREWLRAKAFLHHEPSQD